MNYIVRHVIAIDNQLKKYKQQKCMEKNPLAYNVTAFPSFIVSRILK